MATKLDRFSAEIEKILKEYGDEIQKDVTKAADEVTKKAVQQLKATSPVNQDTGSKRKPGRYAKGWKVKKEGSSDAPIFTVHNATDYQLTHLLEFGHALRRGGRSAGRAKAYPHIAAAEKMMIDEFEKKVREAIRK